MDTSSCPPGPAAGEPLAAREAFLRQIIDINPSFIFVKDRDGRFTLVNRATAEAYGTTPEGLVGKTDADFNKNRSEVEWFLKDDREVMDSLAEKRIAEEVLTDAAGRVRHLTTIKRPVIDPDGVARHVLGVATDITELKRAEARRRELEAQVLHAQKLESLGVLAGGIAHDFNNLLVGILGYADLAARRLPEGSLALGPLTHIRSGAARAAELCRQMLAYAGRGGMSVGSVDLGATVTETLDLLGLVVSKKAVVVPRLADGPLRIQADRTQLQQVIMNLVTNASEALGEGPGTITVATGCLEGSQRLLSDTVLAEPLPDGRYAYLEVSDTGCGMDAETRARIFDPFFTTKFTGRGLGLAAVLGIVRAHRGAIKVYSEPRRGTTMRVLFPLAADEAEAEAAVGAGAAEAGVSAGAAVRRPGAGATVLVVDDEPLVRAVTAEMLAEIGYAVVTAKDGREGLGVFRERASELACVLLDMTMPDMNGDEVLRALREEHPRVPVVLMSGFSEHEVSRCLAGRPRCAFLQKPFTPEALLDAVRTAARSCCGPGGCSEDAERHAAERHAAETHAAERSGDAG